MSYSHRDDAIASLIESELAHRDISVSRDTLILPGQLWEDALRKEVATTDSFVVLVSPNSAAATSYVHREVTWAVREYTAGGLVSSIVPVILPGGDRNAFPKLGRFQSWDYLDSDNASGWFDRLAEGIAATSQRSDRQQPPKA
jgi:TIR domain